MTNVMGIPSQYGLGNHGLRNLNFEQYVDLKIKMVMSMPY